MRRNTGGLTVCITGDGAGVDAIGEQKKLEARKILGNDVESPAADASCVMRLIYELRQTKHTPYIGFILRDLEPF
jgi:hypothetical protein